MICSGAFLLVLVGGRLLNLHADESYFLHLAYALREGWLEGFSTYRPYMLYQYWLGLAIQAGQPASLWKAVALDSLTQLLCMALLVWLGTRQQTPRSWLGFWLVVTGVLFYFSAGRLAEQRPDYLAVTLSFLGMLCLLQGYLVKPYRAHLGALAGIFLAAAVGFSPRALIVLGFGLPLAAPLLLRRWGLAVNLRVLCFALAGAFAIGLIFWLLADFPLHQSLIRLSRMFIDRDGLSCCLSLETRFLDRKVPVAINLGILLSAVTIARMNASERSQLYAWAAAGLAIGQFALIVIDAQIFVYGYSYSLSAYLLLVIALMDLRDDPVPWRRRLPSLVAGAFLLIHVAQLPLVARSQGYLHQREFALGPVLAADASLSSLVRASLRGPDLVPQLQAKILLCEQLPEYRFVSKFHHNPICLRNGFRQLPESYAVVELPGRVFEFPESVDQLAELRDKFGLPKGSVGVLYRTDENGEVVDWIPLR
jgi:hypothetical protein